MQTKAMVLSVCNALLRPPAKPQVSVKICSIALGNEHIPIEAIGEAIGSEAIGSEAIGSEAIGSGAIGSGAIGSGAICRLLKPSAHHHQPLLPSSPPSETISPSSSSPSTSDTWSSPTSTSDSPVVASES